LPVVKWGPRVGKLKKGKGVCKKSSFGWEKMNEKMKDPNMKQLFTTKEGEEEILNRNPKECVLQKSGQG